MNTLQHPGTLVTSQFIYEVVFFLKLLGLQ